MKSLMIAVFLLLSTSVPVSEVKACGLLRDIGKVVLRVVSPKNRIERRQARRATRVFAC